MLHRTASVCSFSSQRKILVYQLFGVERSPHDYSQELANLSRAVHPSGGLEIWQNRVSLEVSAAYRSAREALKVIPKDEVEERAIIVRDALQDATLFAVEKESFDQIG